MKGGRRSGGIRNGSLRGSGNVGCKLRKKRFGAGIKKERRPAQRGGKKKSPLRKLIAAGTSVGNETKGRGQN